MRRQAVIEKVASALASAAPADGGRGCGVGRSAAIVVACSGGADSVALLRSLHHLSTRRGWSLRLVVAHVHHHLRAEADDDARLVAGLTVELGLKPVRADLDGPSLTGNRESAMRRSRYALLRAIAVEHGCGYVATGHHADDQAETLVMRLLRGAGPAGLRGIARRRRLGGDDGHPVTLIRPLLDATRAELRAYLAELDQPYQHDRSNDDATLTRNFVRQRLDDWHARFPGLAGRAVEHGDRFAALSHYLRSEASKYALPMPREAARSLPTALLCEVLRRSLLERGATRDAPTDRVLRPVVRAARDGKGGERRFVIGGVTIVITRDAIRINDEEAHA